MNNVCLRQMHHIAAGDASFDQQPILWYNSGDRKCCYERKRGGKMGFINSYKQLEKLCNEIYGDNHGISSYIDDMSKLTSAFCYVSSWDDDLKQLKHYRWIRNQIVHEPNCTEENMCTDEDAKWLDNFHSRIMSGNDPLALYRKIRSSQGTQKQKSVEYVYPENKRTTSKPTGCLTYLMGVLLIIITIPLIAAAL